MNDVMFFANLIKKVDLHEEAIRFLAESTEKSFKYMTKSTKLLAIGGLFLSGVVYLQMKDIEGARKKIEALDKRIAALEYANCKPEEKQDECHNTEFDAVMQMMD